MDAVGSTATFVQDTTGPDRFEFGKLIEYVASLTGGRTRGRQVTNTCLRSALPARLERHGAKRF